MVIGMPWSMCHRQPFELKNLIHSLEYKINRKYIEFGHFTPIMENLWKRKLKYGLCRDYLALMLHPSILVFNMPIVV